MNDLLVILAISVIIIGFLILVGVAIWLAAERRRHLAAASNTAARQPAVLLAETGEKPAVPAPTAPTAPKEHPADSASATPKDPAGETAPAGTPQTPQKEVLSSGEYPSAAMYDQTLLPQPPKRRTRHQTK